MGKRQWQHYLPQSLLREFGTPTGEVWRYDRVTAQMKPLPPKVIGAEKDLYTLITGDELSHEIETAWFSPLDGPFPELLRKIRSNERLDPAEHIDLANFIAYFRVRTPSAIREAETRWTQFDSLLPADRDSVTYRSGPMFPNSADPESSSIRFTLESERADDVDLCRAEPSVRNDVLRMLVSSGMDLSRKLIRLEYAFLFAARDRAFVIGDNPFVVAPPTGYDTELRGVGPLTPGAAVFVPLSRDVCVRLTSPGWCRSVIRRIGSDEVRALNACQVLNSERYVFCHDENLLRRLTYEFANTPGLNTSQVVRREAVNDKDEFDSLLHLFTRSKINANWALRLPMK